MESGVHAWVRGVDLHEFVSRSALCAPRCTLRVLDPDDMPPVVKFVWRTREEDEEVAVIKHRAEQSSLMQVAIATTVVDIARDRGGAQHLQWPGQPLRTIGMYVQGAVRLGRLLDGWGSAVDRIAIVAYLNTHGMESMTNVGWDVLDFTPTSDHSTGIDMTCYFRPLYSKAAALAAGRPWLPGLTELVSGNRNRTDGASTYYKLLAFALTRYSRVLLVDVDAVLFTNPDGPLLNSSMREASPVEMRCDPTAHGRRMPSEYGAYSCVVSLRPSNHTLRRLMSMASDGCYFPFTNSEQDIMDGAYSCSPHAFSGLQWMHDASLLWRDQRWYRRYILSRSVAARATDADQECYRMRYADAVNLTTRQQVVDHWLSIGFAQRRTLMCSSSGAPPRNGSVRAGIVDSSVLPPPPIADDGDGTGQQCRYGPRWEPRLDGPRERPFWFSNATCSRMAERSARWQVASDEVGPAPPSPPQRLDFLIAGVQKGGTTALANYMRRSSPFLCLKATDRDGTHGEDHQFDDARLSAIDRQPFVRHQICEGSSPSARFGADDPLFSHIANSAIASTLNALAPRTKFVVLLREPVQRAFSQYIMEVNRASRHHPPWFLLRGHPDFLAAMRLEVSRGRPRTPSSADFVWRGFYGAQLEGLHRFFGASRVHVTIAERVFASERARDEQYNRIFTFIGVPPVANFTARGVFTRPAPVSARTAGVSLTTPAALMLRKLYCNDTRHLYAQLGGEVGEWESWYLEQGISEMARGSYNTDRV